MLLSSSPEEPSPRSALPSRGLLFVGVAAAALMGVGLGLWARPAMSERQMALPQVEVSAPVAARRMLQIVLDDTPAPLGAPIELLPRPEESPRAAAPEPPARELLAPIRPPAGLVRVQTLEPEPVEAAPPPTAVRRPEPRPAPQKLAAPKAVKIKAVAPLKAKPPKPRLEKAPKLEKPPKLEKAKAVEKAKPPMSKVAKAKSAPAVSKVAKAAPPTRIAKVDRPVKPTKPPARLAKVDRPPKPARIEKAVVKRPAKLSAPVRAVERIAPRKPGAPPKPQKAKLEMSKPKARPRMEQVAQKAKPVKAAPVRALKPVKGAGPLRLAKAQPRPRPDTVIRDADRQMDRAYSTARAAGVPDWQLRKQQARWEAARASAAREAPWAVRDVYLARIAELHDLTKDAQAPGY